MTRTELTALEVLIGEFRDFRREDTRWKSTVDTRLRSVEFFVAAEESEDDAATASGISHRAYLALSASIAATAVALIFGIANLIK